MLVRVLRSYLFETGVSQAVEHFTRVFRNTRTEFIANSLSGVDGLEVKFLFQDRLNVGLVGACCDPYSAYTGVMQTPQQCQCRTVVTPCTNEDHDRVLMLKSY